MGAKKGEKPHRRVEEGAVAASGLGMETTDQNADSVGLMTLASSPMADQQVNEKTADTINPNTTSAGSTEPADRSLGPAVELEPPRHKLYTTSHNRMLLSEDALGSEVQEVAASHEGVTGDEVEGGETDNEDRRAHERINDERSWVEMSEDETIMTTISASAPSVLCNHPDKDTVPTDPARQLRDPADTPDGDEHCPDKPTELPNKMEGTGGRDGDARVKMEVLRTSRGHAEVTGEISNEPC